MQNLIGKVINKDPIIFYSWMYSGKQNTPLDQFQEAIKDKDAIILMWVPWSLELHYKNYYDPINNIKNWIHERYAKWPKHRFIYICNTYLESFQLNKNGIPAKTFNQNAFIDPNIYKYFPNEEKIYKSVYNAQIVDFKRHELLRDVESCLLLAHTIKKEVFEKVQKKLTKNFILLNEYQDDGKSISVKGLTWEEIIIAVNSAKVGLCLSKIEGAMHAAVEYLLCGLPVVSTWNTGGRDFLFDSRFCFSCPDDPFVIAESVSTMASLNFDGAMIRNETIKKQKLVIEEFCSFLSKIVFEYNSNTIDFQKNWDKFFINKFHEHKTVDQHLADIINMVEYE